MPDPFLSREMVARITARKTRKAQRRKLDDMGIAYLQDGDGWPLVLADKIVPRREKSAPNWSALEGGKVVPIRGGQP